MLHQAQNPATSPARLDAPATLALIQARRTVQPKRLLAPGPNASQLAQLFEAAAAAPDHGRLLPWRFVVVPAQARWALADVFEQALLARHNPASLEQIEQARDKAFRAPLLMLALVRMEDEGSPVPATVPDPMPAQVPSLERVTAAGCAVQNLLLMATAQGFGSALSSGSAMQWPGLNALFSVGPHERALCFVSVGTAAAWPAHRERAAPERFVSRLDLPRQVRLCAAP